MIHMIIILIASLLIKIGTGIVDHIQNRNAVREALRRTLQETQRKQEEMHNTREEKKDQ